MGRSPCCEKLGLKKGPWTPEEDQKLLAYIEENGHGNWRALPARAGLERCGKSCRLRWTNYLRSDIKRGKFSLQEEQTIIQLHALLGNRWSAIATHLPKRTDNEIKNYWNTHLKKRLAKMGIDPVTHKLKNDALLPTVGGGQQSKNAAKLSHMAQWESARLEAESRLARQSKLRSNSSSLGAHQDHLHPGLGLKSYIWPNSNIPTTYNDHEHEEVNIGIVGTIGMGSPTSTLSFSESRPAVGPNSGSVIEFMGHINTTTPTCDNLGGLVAKEEGEISNANEWKISFNDEDNEDRDQNHNHNPSFVEGFTELLLSSMTTTTTTITDETITMTSCNEKSLGEGEPETNYHNTTTNNNINNDTTSSGRGDYYEDNKNYWNNILNLVNSSPSDSPMF